MVRVEPDDLVCIADIARRAGRTNEGIRLLIRGDRGPGGFPAPTTRIGSGRSRVRRWTEVEQWFTRYEKHSDVAGAESYSATVALVNDFLRMRVCVAPDLQPGGGWPRSHEYASGMKTASSTARQSGSASPGTPQTL